ncbi:MAG: SAM-dependent methyltransferase [Candidatus Odinarchaeota archaeon]
MSSKQIPETTTTEMDWSAMIADKQAFDDLQDQLRHRLLPHLRQAFQKIPPMIKPQILDIGCGSGVPTLELAQLSGGDVTGIDIDTNALQRLEEKIQAADLSDRVHVVKGSLKAMDFPAASFDILWAEGSIFVIGFKQGLKAWKRFLKPEGYLVIHDAVGNLDQKKQQITACGYKLEEYFLLGQEVWWDEYYEPLNQVVQQIRHQNTTDPQLLTALEQAETEIQGYSKHPERYQSVYFIMRDTTEA